MEVTRDESDLRSIPGWLLPADEALLRFVLREQRRQGTSGDLAEFGVYMGKCAVLIGDYVEADEVFTVVDLFEDARAGSQKGGDKVELYERLTERAFRDHYQRFHSRPPVVVRGPSACILDRARIGRHRLVHVDASHTYDDVRVDTDSAKALLQPDGIVVFDDYRSAHTPGTAAAVWEALGRTGLVPLIVSDVKLYGTWGDPRPWQDRFARWLPASAMASEVHMIAGHPVRRVWSTRAATPARRIATALTPPAILRRVDAAVRNARGHA